MSRIYLFFKRVTDEIARRTRDSIIYFRIDMMRFVILFHHIQHAVFVRDGLMGLPMQPFKRQIMQRNKNPQYHRDIGSDA